MTDLQVLLNELGCVNGHIDSILKKTKFLEYDDLSGLDIDRTDADELQLQDELRSILFKIAEINRNIAYLQRRVIGTSTLYLQDNGRYAYDFDGRTHELTCGCGIELLVYDEFESYNQDKDVYKWVASSIEADENGYYLVGNKKANLNGAKVRIRK